MISKYTGLILLLLCGLIFPCSVCYSRTIFEKPATETEVVLEFNEMQKLILLLTGTSMQPCTKEEILNRMELDSSIFDDCPMQSYFHETSEMSFPVVVAVFDSTDPDKLVQSLLSNQSSDTVVIRSGTSVALYQGNNAVFLSRVCRSLALS